MSVEDDYSLQHAMLEDDYYWIGLHEWTPGRVLLSGVWYTDLCQRCCQNRVGHARYIEVIEMDMEERGTNG